MIISDNLQNELSRWEKDGMNAPGVMRVHRIREMKEKAARRIPFSRMFARAEQISKEISQSVERDDICDEFYDILDHAESTDSKMTGLMALKAFSAFNKFVQREMRV